MAVALGAVADAHGLETVLWVIAVLPLPAVLLALVLPRERLAAGAAGPAGACGAPLVAATRGD